MTTKTARLQQRKTLAAKLRISPNGKSLKELKALWDKKQKSKTSTGRKSSKTTKRKSSKAAKTEWQAAYDAARRAGVGHVKAVIRANKVSSYRPKSKSITQLPEVGRADSAHKDSEAVPTAKRRAKLVSGAADPADQPADAVSEAEAIIAKPSPTFGEADHPQRANSIRIDLLEEKVDRLATGLEDLLGHLMQLTK